MGHDSSELQILAGLPAVGHRYVKGLLRDAASVQHRGGRGLRRGETAASQEPGR